jgi:hypothetical protein
MTKENLVLLTVRLYNLTLFLPKKEPLRCRARETADDILASFVGGRKESNGFSLKESLDIMDSYLEVAMSQNWVATSEVLEIKREYAKINQDLDSSEEVSQAKKAGDIKVKEIDSAGDQEQVKDRAPVKEETPIKEDRSPSSIQVVMPAPLMVPMAETAQAFIEPKEGEDADDEDDEDLGALTESQIKRQRRIIEFLKEKGQAQVWEIQKVFPDISKRTIRRDFRTLLKQGLIERVGERNKTYYKMKVNLS